MSAQRVRKDCTLSVDEGSNVSTRLADESNRDFYIQRADGRVYLRCYDGDHHLRVVGVVVLGPGRRWAGLCGDTPDLPPRISTATQHISGQQHIGSGQQQHRINHSSTLRPEWHSPVRRILCHRVTRPPEENVAMVDFTVQWENGGNPSEIPKVVIWDNARYMIPSRYHR
jgi:hypothetical protein